MPEPNPTAPGSVLYVVPTLGRRPEYLVQTLDSLAAQDHPAVTVVVVAPVGSEDVRRETEARGMTYLDQRSSGMSGAINEGWQLAGDGHDYWAWLGDDDTLTAGSATTAAKFLDGHQDVAMVYGRCAYVDEDGALLHVVRPTSLAARLMRWGPNLVPQPGSVARASAVRRVGLLDENLRYAMDLDLFLRLADVGRIAYLPSTLAQFRWHAESTTVASSAASSQEAELVRRRTWTGRRAVAQVAAPAATLLGRVLHRAQRGW